MTDLSTTSQSYADQAEDHLARSAEADVESAPALAMRGIGYALLAIRSDLATKEGDVVEAVIDLRQQVCGSLAEMREHICEGLAELAELTPRPARPSRWQRIRERFWGAFYFPDKYDSYKEEVAP